MLVEQVGLVNLEASDPGKEQGGHETVLDPRLLSIALRSAGKLVCSSSPDLCTVLAVKEQLGDDQRLEAGKPISISIEVTSDNGVRVLPRLHLGGEKVDQVIRLLCRII